MNRIPASIAIITLDKKPLLRYKDLPDAILKCISRISPFFKFVERKTLFFFDEIQEFPDIVTSLKYFAIDGKFESIIGEALVKSGYFLCYYKKENSTLQEEFFVRSADYLVPIEVKAGNNKSKSLSTLIKSEDYKEISFGIKLIKGNVGYEKNICTFPHFCAFLIKDFLASFDYMKKE